MFPASKSNKYVKQYDRFDTSKQIVRVKLLLVCLHPAVTKLLKMCIARFSLTTEEMFHDFIWPMESTPNPKYVCWWKWLQAKHLSLKFQLSFSFTNIIL